MDYFIYLLHFILQVAFYRCRHNLVDTLLLQILEFQKGASYEKMEKK